MVRKGGGTVDSPTGVHQEGVNARWNGCCLMRGLVGQDKSYFMWFPWITKLDLEPLACCSSSCSSQARSSALAPTPAAACKDRTSPEMSQRPPPPTTRHTANHPPPTAPLKLVHGRRKLPVDSWVGLRGSYPYLSD